MRNPITGKRGAVPADRQSTSRLIQKTTGFSAVARTFVALGLATFSLTSAAPAQAFDLDGILTEATDTLAHNRWLDFSERTTLPTRTGLGGAEYIVGGQTVSASDPIVRTTAAMLSEKGALCTVSIVSSNLAVTAAHCVSDGSRRFVLIFETNVNTPNPTTLPVVAVAANPAFAPGSTGTWNDIALVRFRGALPPGYSAAALLPATQPLANGQRVTLAGFGITGQNREDSGILRKVVAPIAVANYNNSEVVIDQRSGRGACHGDSGGPAFVQSGGTLLLWGVTSRGHPPNAPDDCVHFAVYTNINAHRAWLRSTADRLPK